MDEAGTLSWNVRESLADEELQELFSSVYKRPNTVPFHQILANCLFWVSARRSGQLMGFANVIWDGLYHALIVDRAALDETVKHQLALKVLEVLKQDYPTVSKVHIECDSREIPLLVPLGFEPRTYGRILY